MKSGPLLAIAMLLTLCAVSAAEELTYWKDIRPLFRRHCTVCHTTKNLKEPEVSGGLALEKYESAMKGGKRPILIPGKSKQSPILQLLVSEDDNRRMPKDALSLSNESIDLIARWIDTGAKEGARPDLATPVTPTTTARPRRRLEVILPTNATPPNGILSPSNAGKLELILKAGPLPPVTAVAFSPDGKLLASGTYGQVTIWDLVTGKPARVLTNVLGSVNDLRFSPDGSLLAVAGGQPSARGDLRLVRTADWQLAATLGGHEDVVSSVAFRPDGKQLASAGFDKTVRLWDLTTNKLIRVIDGHSDFVYSVAFSSDGQWLASAGKDRSVKLTDAATGASRATFSGMDQDVFAVAISPDGKSVVSSGLEPGIYWWNPQTSERVRVQGGHGVAVHELAFSKDGKSIVSAGADGTVRVWNGGTGAAVRTLSIGPVTYAAAVSCDGKRIASGSFDGLVRLWDVESGRHLVTLMSLPNADEQPQYLTVTPEGFADAPAAVRGQAVWRMAGQPVAAEAVWKTLGHPDAVAKALRGEPLPAPSFMK